MGEILRLLIPVAQLMENIRFPLFYVGVCNAATEKATSLQRGCRGIMIIGHFQAFELGNQTQQVVESDWGIVEGLCVALFVLEIYRGSRAPG